ncbi:MAG: hypothetical protein ACWA42_08695 [Lutibacter sp.]
METNSKKVGTSFYVISIVALVWNVLGVISYLGQVYMTDDKLKLLPIDQQNYYAHVPGWVTGAFALSVFAGAIGCIALLLRKGIALWLFWISFIAVIAQFIYNFILQDDMKITTNHYIMPVIIFLIAIYLIIFARKGIKSGILR